GTSSSFPSSPSTVTASTPVTISASSAGVIRSPSLHDALPIFPSASSLTLNPTRVTGGAQSSTGTVTLSGPAPAGGAQVALSSSNDPASVPASSTVAAGR